MESNNSSLKPGSVLQNGKYRILSVFGQGGFGITYSFRLRATTAFSFRLRAVVTQSASTWLVHAVPIGRRLSSQLARTTHCTSDSIRPISGRTGTTAATGSLFVPSQNNNPAKATGLAGLAIRMYGG